MRSWTEPGVPEDRSTQPLSTSSPTFELEANEMKTCKLLSIVAFAWVTGSCGPEGRLLADDAPQMVGSEAAGGETYDKTVREAMEKLLGEQTLLQSTSADSKKVVAF